jgi:hypothetical protein
MMLLCRRSRGSGENRPGPLEISRVAIGAGLCSGLSFSVILYHYTTATGLNGIVRSRSIWASHYRFLNDATEFRYGLGMFEQIFASTNSVRHCSPLM